VYNNKKFAGMMMAVLLLFIIPFQQYMVGYLPLVVHKCTLIILSGIVLFSALLFECIRNVVNRYSILTHLFRLNILCLIVTVYNPIILCLNLLLVLTTPSIFAKNGNVEMKPNVVSIHWWVVLYTVFLIFYYMINPYFCSNLLLVILALVIPCILHFVSNQFIESRVICLFLFILFDIVHNAKKTIGDFIRESKH